jgi:subtilisin family serine protease
MPQDVAAPSITAAKSANQNIRINVVLSRPATDAQLAELGKYGKVSGRLIALNAVFMLAPASALPSIQALRFVLAASPDAERLGAPVDAVSVADFTNGFNTWNMDAVNITNFGAGRTIGFTGAGVYIAVLDSGLLDSWRQYFPEERIAEEFAASFTGGPINDDVPDQPNKWEHDQNSHGTHVTSTILGYSLRGTPINGSAPLATVIPVKVLNQNGSGWSSVVAQGIVYITNLKRSGSLGTSPVVINMSLGGPALEAVEKAAIDYAVANGVIIVASAGNRGTAGMGFPGAYAPVISVAASGWINEWLPAGNNSWWNNRNVADPTAASDFYIASFSSRARPGQDLDVAAPGSWVVGPYQLQSGKTSYFFLGGTSMSSPHVAGIVAMMLQKNPSLTAGQAESILETTAIPLPPGSRTVFNPGGTTSSTVSWGADATGAGLATADAALTATP